MTQFDMHRMDELSAVVAKVHFFFLAGVAPIVVFGGELDDVPF